MKVDLFTDYVQDPKKLNADSIGELSELVNIYPYFQTSRVLLTLNLFKEKHVRYEAELGRTAIYAGNRSILKKHIDQLSRKSRPVVLPDEHVQPEIALAEIEIISREQPEEMEVAEPLIEEKVEPKEEAVVISAEPTAVVEDEIQEEEQDTLSQLKRIVAERLKQIELDREQKIAVQPAVEKQKEIPPKPESTKTVSELIETFIKNEPRLSKPKATFFNPEDAARNSIVDEENIVSETLAQIYFDQNRFGKAIAVYKKLSLKYPEKSSYFAPLIEKAIEELKK